jgi:cytochrome b subunit of formate dehydrogenase
MSDDKDSIRNQAHRGYDLEAGMLARAREWVDLFPALRLWRVLRVAGSPSLLMLTAVVLLLWLAGQTLWGGFRDATPLPGDITEAWGWFGEPGGALLQLVGIQPTDSRWQRLAHIAWTVAILAPLAMLLARQGALLTAGRTMMTTRAAIGLACRRAPGAWLTAVVPLLCASPFMLAALLPGGLAIYWPDYQPLQAVAGVWVALLALPAGLLVFGSLVAVPISWAALINEPDADPLDALSRGYEYLFRRPVQLVCYGLMSLLLIAILSILATVMAVTTGMIISVLFAWSDERVEMINVSLWLVSRLPHVVAVTLVASMAGGIYLLLRHDAGGQEVEDLWQPPPAPQVPLPRLPVTDESTDL